MNTMIRHKNSSDALGLAAEVLGDGLTRAGDLRRDRARLVQEMVGRIVDLAPDGSGGPRLRDEAMQVAALAAAVPDGAEADAPSLLAAGYAPQVVEAVARLTRDPGRLSLVQDSEDLARSGAVAAMATRYAEMTYDSRTDRIMRLPPEGRGVLGVYHKSRKALGAGLLDAAGIDPRPVEDAAPVPERPPGPSLAEARAATGRQLSGKPAAPLALALLDHVGAAAPIALTLAEALAAMGREKPDPDALEALAALSQGASAPFEAAIVFRDARGMTYPVTAPENEAAARDGYRHPVTGEAVPDPQSSFFLRLTPRPGLFSPVPEAPPAPDSPAA